MPQPGHCDDIDPASAIVSRARALIPAIEAAAPRIEAERRLPADVLAQLVDGGFFRLLLPRTLGGNEMEPAIFAEVVEALARGDGSVAWCVAQACGCSMAAAYLAPAAAAEIFGPADSVVAWGPGRGEAIAVSGGYLVTGEWNFASGSHHAAWLGGRCGILEEPGVRRRKPDGSPVERTVLFPRSDARMTDIWSVVGLKGTGSDRYAVDAVFVPEARAIIPDYTLVPEEGARPNLDGKLYALPAQSVYGAGFGGIALGIARGALDAFVALAHSKSPRGGAALLREDGVVQLEYGRAEARIGAARALLLQTARELWDDVSRTGAYTLDHRMRMRLAVTHAIHESKDAVGSVYHAAGTTSVFTSQPFERRFRDINTVTQQLQGRLSHIATVGQHLLGLEPDARLV